jgi:hypothetical protein
VLTPVKDDTGLKLLSFNVGGVAGADAEQLTIEAAVERLGLTWLPIEGRPERPGLGVFGASTPGWVQGRRAEGVPEIDDCVLLL